MNLELFPPLGFSCTSYPSLTTPWLQKQKNQGHNISSLGSTGSNPWTLIRHLTWEVFSLPSPTEAKTFKAFSHPFSFRSIFMLCVCMNVYQKIMSDTLKWATYGSELPWRCWELNQVEQLLLITEPSLQPFVFSFLWFYWLAQYGLQAENLSASLLSCSVGPFPFFPLLLSSKLTH